MSTTHGAKPSTRPRGVTDRSSRRSGSGPGDTFVGVVFGVLAGSNLVQGSWSQELPWLNLTAASFALALPATLVALRHHLAMRSTIAVLILTIALTLGYLHPALNAAAHGKRLSLIITVLLLSIASMVCLTNDRRLRAFFVTVVAMAAVVLLGQLLAPDPVFLAIGRRTPQGLNSIGAGRVLGAGLVITFASTLKRSALTRTALLLFVCLPFGFGIVLAGSRGPLLGVVVALTFLLLVQPRVSVARKVLVLALGAPALYLAQSFVAATGSRIGAATGSGRGVLIRPGCSAGAGVPARHRLGELLPLRSRHPTQQRSVRDPLRPQRGPGVLGRGGCRRWHLVPHLLPHRVRHRSPAYPLPGRAHARRPRGQLVRGGSAQ